MRTILVTGASGVVGRRVVPRLTTRGNQVICAVREGRAPTGANRRIRTIDEIGPRTEWRTALEGVDTVVHLAAQTPAVGVTDEEFERVNVQGTERLARQAAESGVRLLVFVSSVVAVVGNSTLEPVDENTEPRPVSAYGRSKLSAEAHVRSFSTLGRTAVILRPPMVHAPDAKGNWHLLQRLAASPLPLPFGSALNRRNVISATSLADAIGAIIKRSEDETVHGTYTIADDPALSLREIVHHLRAGFRRSSGLLPIPIPIMALPLRMGGRRGMADSLFGDLVVNSKLFRETFSWDQPVDSALAVEQTAEAFLERHNDNGLA